MNCEVSHLQLHFVSDSWLPRGKVYCFLVFKFRPPRLPSKRFVLNYETFLGGSDIMIMMKFS